MIEICFSTKVCSTPEKIPILEELTLMDSLDAEVEKNDDERQLEERIFWGQLLPINKKNCREKIIFMPRREERNGRKLNEFTIGRSSVLQCDIVAIDQRISQRHCKIYCATPVGMNGSTSPGEVRVFIEDLSSNGTWVNGVHLSRNSGKIRVRQLHNGDQIDLLNPRKTPEPSIIQDSGICESIGDEAHICTRFVFLSAVMTPTKGAFSNIGKKKSNFGSISDKYHVMHIIGHGTSGEVRLAQCIETGDEFAVKVIESKRFPSTSGITSQDVITEADMLRTVNHPNIIRLFDIFEDNKSVYLVMELVRGGDLFDRIIDKKRYTEELGRQLLIRILEAVSYLHSNGIVHRDLKPENILMVSHDNDVEVKLTDFGLAKRSVAGDELKTFCGTPQYFAPEVLKRRNTVQGSGRYGKAADMWSIGIIFYVMLSGTHPFHDSTLYEQIQNAYFSFESPEWMDIGESAKDLICRLINVDPNSRLTADQALAHPFCSGQEISVNFPHANSLEYSSIPNSEVSQNIPFTPMKYFENTSTPSKSGFIHRADAIQTPAGPYLAREILNEGIFGAPLRSKKARKWQSRILNTTGEMGTEDMTDNSSSGQSLSYSPEVKVLDFRRGHSVFESVSMDDQILSHKERSVSLFDMSQLGPSLPIDDDESSDSSQVNDEVECRMFPIIRTPDGKAHMNPRAPIKNIKARIENKGNISNSTVLSECCADTVTEGNAGKRKNCDPHASASKKRLDSKKAKGRINVRSSGRLQRTLTSFLR